MAVVFQNCDGYQADQVVAGSDGQINPNIKCKNFATLKWLVPTTNADGTALNMAELGGYKIFYGRSSQGYDLTIDIKNGLLDTYKIDGLAPGVYYFAIKAYKKAGVESQFSNEAVLNLETCNASGEANFSSGKTMVSSL